MDLGTYQVLAQTLCTRAEMKTEMAMHAKAVRRREEAGTLKQMYTHTQAMASLLYYPQSKGASYTFWEELGLVVSAEKKCPCIAHCLHKKATPHEDPNLGVIAPTTALGCRGNT